MTTTSTAKSWLIHSCKWSIAKNRKNGQCRELFFAWTWNSTKQYKPNSTESAQSRSIHAIVSLVNCLHFTQTHQTNECRKRRRRRRNIRRESIYIHAVSSVCVCIYKHNYEPAHDYYCRINGAIYFIMIFCIRRFVAVNGSVAWVLGALKYFCVVLSCLVLCCIQIWFYVHALCLKCLHE